MEAGFFGYSMPPLSEVESKKTPTGTVHNTEQPSTSGWDEWLRNYSVSEIENQSSNNSGPANVEMFDRGLFADMTNQAKSGKPPAPMTPNPIRNSMNAESPGATIAMRMAELVVTPDAGKQRPADERGSLDGSVSSGGGEPMPPCVGMDSLPPFAFHQDQQTKFLVVEYKMNRRQKIRCPADIKVSVDDFVILEIDQNVAWAGDKLPVDVAQVIGIYSFADRHLIPRALGHPVGTVLRVANEEDCEIINNKLHEKESEGLKACHQLIHFLHVPFGVLDAEYSFDLRQVRFWYELSPTVATSNAPNVSRLQRELGVRLGCRVVMEQSRQQCSRKQ